MAIENMGIQIGPADTQGLFKSFDKNGDGVINFEEFITVVKGPMNEFRSDLVLRIFKHIDVTMDGYMDVKQVLENFNASQHPDVKSGKRKEKDVRKEFVDSFNQHHEIVNHGSADTRVYFEEFNDFCAHISSNIDSDAFFELMMSNAWGLNLAKGGAMPFAGSARKITHVNARDAYRADHHRNLFGTDSKTPFDKTPQTEW
jgi:calcyphosin